jgi:hypothetical protein
MGERGPSHRWQQGAVRGHAKPGHAPAAVLRGDHHAPVGVAVRRAQNARARLNKNRTRLVKLWANLTWV